MPKGTPNAQTTASKKYQEKIGLIAKSYKIKRSTADAFAKACEKAGVGQAATLTRLMLEFAKEQGIEPEE